MRTNVARSVVVFWAIVALSGCYSNGKWSMPSFAKSSPFRTSPDAATPGPTGSPKKPSALATANTTAPPSPYSTTVQPPMVSYSTAPSTYNNSSTAGGVASSYPTTQPLSTAAPQGAAAYTASNAAIPGVNAYGTSPTTAGATNGATVPTASYGAMPNYAGANPNAAMPSYNTTPSYPAVPASGYPAANSAGVAASTGYATGAAVAGMPQNSLPTTASVNGMAAPAYQAPTTGVASAEASRYSLGTTAATPAAYPQSTPSTAGLGATAANNTAYGAGLNAGATAPAASSYSAMPGSRYTSQVGATVPATGSRYSTPNTTAMPPYATPTADYSATAAGSPLGTTLPTQPNAATSAWGATTAATSPYRPGGTSDYVNTETATAGTTPSGATVETASGANGVTSYNYPQTTGY